MAQQKNHRLTAAGFAATDAGHGPEPVADLKIRGRSFMALVLAPEPPLGAWFAALDQRLQAAAGFFTDRPVVVDLAAAFEEGGRDAALIVLDGLEARSLRLVGIEGIDPRLLAGTRWAELPKSLQGRELSLPQPADPTSRAGAAAPEAEAAPSSPSLLIDRPVRSGQSIVFAEGDVIVVGTINSGAEVIAGGSIHVYGALRGRAIAGLRVGPSARIFCRKMEAELVGVDQLYRTAEHWGSGVHGRPVQIRCDRGALRLTPID